MDTTTREFYVCESSGSPSEAGWYDCLWSASKDCIPIKTYYDPLMGWSASLVPMYWRVGVVLEVSGQVELDKPPLQRACEKLGVVAPGDYRWDALAIEGEGSALCQACRDAALWRLVGVFTERLIELVVSGPNASRSFYDIGAKDGNGTEWTSGRSMGDALIKAVLETGE